MIQASLAQRNIPPHNPGARVAAEAYPADRLVPPALADALEITKLFPAANKPEYRDTLRGSGMVRRRRGEGGWARGRRKSGWSGELLGQPGKIARGEGSLLLQRRPLSPSLRPAPPRTHPPTLRPPTSPASLQFGEGYVLTRLPVLATQDKGAREERARMLALLGHLLKLNVRPSLRAVPCRAVACCDVLCYAILQGVRCARAPHPREDALLAYQLGFMWPIASFQQRPNPVAPCVIRALDGLLFLGLARVAVHVLLIRHNSISLSLSPAGAVGRDEGGAGGPGGAG